MFEDFKKTEKGKIAMLVSDSKLPEAIERTMSLCYVLGEHFKQAVILSMELHHLEAENRRGSISWDEFNRSRRKLAQRILDLIF